MANILPPVEFATITGRFMVAGNDSDDPGAEADIVPAKGKGSIIPSVGHVLVAGATPPATVKLATVYFEIDSEGYICDAETKERNVEVIAPSEAVNPSAFTYRINFDGGLFPGFDFYVVPGSTIDLTDVGRVATSVGVATTRGEPGVGIESMTLSPDQSSLVVIYDNLSEQTVEIPALGEIAQQAQATTDEVIATALADPNSATRAAGNATYGTKVEVASKADPASDVGLVASPAGGTTDDVPKIAALLAALPAGGTLQLRPGTYRIASLLSINKPVRIRGAGRGQTTLHLIANRFLSADASNVTFESMTFSAPNGNYRLFNESKTTAVNRIGWTFRDCKFDSVGLSFSKIGGVRPDGTATTAGTDVAGSITVTDCEVTGYKGQYGIELQGVDGAVVENCWVHHIGTPDNLNGEGVKVLYCSTGVRISNNVLEDNYRDGIDVYSGSEVLITGNTLRRNATWGVESKWSSNDDAGVNGAYRVLITNNHVSENGSGGLLGATPGAIVEGNHLWGHAGRSLVVGGAMNASSSEYTSGVIVRGNRTQGGSYGIDLSGAVRDAIVEGNITTGATVDGIALQPQTQDCIVTGNRSFGNGNKGIRVSGSGHRIGTNKSQDPGDAYITPGITGVMRAQMVAAP